MRRQPFMRPPRATQEKKSAFVGVVVIALRLGFHAEVVIAAEVHRVIGRIAVFVDVDVEIVLVVVTAQIAVGLGVLLLLGVLGQLLEDVRAIVIQHGRQQSTVSRTED